jgi:hypothetical protein
MYISQTKLSYSYITRHNFNLIPETNYTLIERRDDINVDVTLSWLFVRKLQCASTTNDFLRMKVELDLITISEA